MIIIVCTCTNSYTLLPHSLVSQTTITLITLIILTAIGILTFSWYKFFISTFKDQEILYAYIRVFKAINNHLAIENDQLHNQNATNFE